MRWVGGVGKEAGEAAGARLWHAAMQGSVTTWMDSDKAVKHQRPSTLARVGE